jgi:hypothetical protein
MLELDAAMLMKNRILSREKGKNAKRMAIGGGVVSGSQAGSKEAV